MSITKIMVTPDNDSNKNGDKYDNNSTSKTTIQSKKF